MGNTFKVRDKLEFWYCRVDMAVFTDEALSIYDSHVYAALCSFATQGGDCFPSVKTLAKRAKCSERQARISLRVLEEQGYITTEAQNGGVNIYTLTREKHLRNTPAHDAEGTAQSTGGGGTPCPQTKANELDIKNNPSGEPPAPVGEKNENQAEPPELLLPPSEAPEAMKQTAEYLLLKTGRTGLSWEEISALRTLNASHYPARVQKEVDTALERFKRLGRPPGILTFCYIAESLMRQSSRAPARGVPKSKPRDAPDYSELNV